MKISAEIKIRLILEIHKTTLCKDLARTKVRDQGGSPS